VTGLANAIAHVSANCQAHPNRGLVNALNHLQANLARQQSRDAGPNKDATGKSKENGSGHSQGKSHGHSKD
jgi:hypothetical protein